MSLIKKYESSSTNSFSIENIIFLNSIIDRLYLKILKEKKEYIVFHIKFDIINFYISTLKRLSLDSYCLFYHYMNNALTLMTFLNNEKIKISNIEKFDVEMPFEEQERIKNHRSSYVDLNQILLSSIKYEDLTSIDNKFNSLFNFPIK